MEATPKHSPENFSSAYIKHGCKASFAVVIDGDTLRFALGEQYGLKALFLNLATQCETVVCCRVSPAQKALTVKLVGCSPLPPLFFLFLLVASVQTNSYTNCHFFVG